MLDTLIYNETIYPMSLEESSELSLAAVDVVYKFKESINMYWILIIKRLYSFTLLIQSWLNINISYDVI